METHYGKFFDCVKTDKYFGDLQEAIQSYEKFAKDHLLDIDATVSTDAWQGADADAFKLQLTNIETGILQEIVNLQKDVNNLCGEIIENFGKMVDDAKDAYIDCDIIDKVNNDFKIQRDSFVVAAKLAEDKILELQSTYSKYGDISTPDFSKGMTAFNSLCGENSAEVGYLSLCIQKLINFDTEARDYIELQKFGERIAQLNRKMCMSVHMRHPEYGLGAYLDDLNGFEERYKHIIHADDAKSDALVGEYISSKRFDTNSYNKFYLDIIGGFYERMYSQQREVYDYYESFVEDINKLQQEAVFFNRNYSDGFEDSLKNDFQKGVVVYEQANEDMVLVHYSSDSPLASLRYWTTIDEANGISTVEEYMDKLALSKYWGKRDVVKVCRIEKGTIVKHAIGNAREQVSILDRRPGRGVQVLFNEFNTSWITEIRSFKETCYGQ